MADYFTGSANENAAAATAARAAPAEAMEEIMVSLPPLHRGVDLD